MAVDLDQIETFLAVVSARSFSKAARRLNTTQPAVSLRIQALETSLGKRLLDRTTRDVSLTPEGRAFLDYAERMAALRQEAQLAIADPDRVTGTVRLGVSETVVHAWLPDLIEELSRRFPAVELELTVDTTAATRDLLVGRELDLAFLMGPVAEPEMVNHPLCSFPLVWVAPPAFDLPEPATLNDLARYRIITYSRRTRPTVALTRMLQAAGIRDARLIASTSLATNNRLVESGVGVAPLPAFTVEEAIAAGRLRRVVVIPDAELEPLAFTVTHPAATRNALVGRVVACALECAVAFDKK